MSDSRTINLGSITGRDEFIIGDALAIALIALEQLPAARQPKRCMTDMKCCCTASIFPQRFRSISQPRDGVSFRVRDLLVPLDSWGEAGSTRRTHCSA